MTIDTVSIKGDFEELCEILNRVQGFKADCLNRLCSDTDELTALKIVARLSETLADSSKKLLNALESSDTQTLWNACHKMAGSTDLVGFKDFAKSAKDLCHRTKASVDLASLKVELKELGELAQSISTQIRAACPNWNSYLS